MSNHTESPWECFREADGTNIAVVAHGSLIANVPGPHDREANARLIAASPDLLAALKDMTEIVRAAVEYDGATWCRERLARAEAAIAKAEGRNNHA